MADTKLSAIGYRITLETMNGFFGAWLKRNLFTRQRWLATLLFTVILMGLMIFSGWSAFSDMFDEPNMPFWFTPLMIGLMATLTFIFSLIIAGIAAYLLSPMASYLWMTANFLIGPVRKRINNADVSNQGITKSYGTFSHTTPWNAVYDLVETRKSLLIFTNRNCAMMIPKGAFETPEAAGLFLATARELWHAAKA